MTELIKKQKINNRGFSLVEMLVAIGIFMSIMTIAITSLISIISANKKAQAIKSTIDNVTFAVETMSRDMRVGNSYQCSTDGYVFAQQCNDRNDNIGGIAVRYINNLGKLITYKYNSSPTNSTDGVLTRTECPDKVVCNTQGQNDGKVDNLISQDSNVNITNMKFYVVGADNENNPVISERTQPKIIITVSGLISVKDINDTTFNLQTSVSQRSRR